MNSRQEFEKIYSVENQANVMTEALFEIFNKGWQAARKPKHTREDVTRMMFENSSSKGRYIDGVDDFQITIDVAIDALIEAGIITVKGADANDD